MVIKSSLSKSDFAQAVVMYHDGDYDSLHQIILSYGHRIGKYNHISNYTTRENLRAAAWEGLVEGVIKALDGRIPLSELYDRVGPYASCVIDASIAKYWEMTHFIRIPASTIRGQKGSGQKITRPKITSLDAQVSQSDSRTISDVVLVDKEDDPVYTKEEILELLRVTEREKKILNALLDGQKQKDIAADLGMVKSNVTMIVGGIRKRAIEMGLDLVNHSRR